MIRIYAKDYTLQDVQNLQQALTAALLVSPDSSKNPVTRDLLSALDFTCRLSQVLRDGRF